MLASKFIENLDSAPLPHDLEIIEVFSDLELLYLNFYVKIESIKAGERLCEDPEVIKGLEEIYKGVFEMFDNHKDRPKLEEDLKLLEELGRSYVGSGKPATTLTENRHTLSLSAKTEAMYDELLGPVERERQAGAPKRSLTRPMLKVQGRKVLPNFKKVQVGKSKLGAEAG